MLSLEMNDRVAVVGSAFTADLMRHATFWQNGTLTDLGGQPASRNRSAATSTTSTVWWGP
jgi:probable HAF family extracellular repeat protein